MRVLNERPNAIILLVGNDSPIVSYGKNREDGRGWLSFLKEKYKKELDWSRIINLGTITHQQLRIVYQVTSAHVYLTYPFVLSWSLLEAMSCGALVICSNTSPVKEVVRHGENGILVDFNDHEMLSKQIIDALESPNKYHGLRLSARKSIVENYCLEQCIKKQIKLVESFAVTAAEES